MVRYESVIVESYNASELTSKINAVIGRHIGMKIHSITNIAGGATNCHSVLIIFQYREKAGKKLYNDDDLLPIGLSI